MRVFTAFRWASVALGLTAASGNVFSAATEFNFDNIPDSAFLTSQSLPNGQGPTASSTSVQTFMDSVLSCANCVTVTGAMANGGVTSKGVNRANYTGDGFVVGPTLATYQNPGDANHNHVFIMNNNFGLWSGVDTPSTVSPNSFTFTFGGASIASVAFDWEIFPDLACQGGLNKTTCKTLPAIVLSTNGGAVLWTQLANAQLTTNPQGIGGLVSVNFPSGSNQITFTDWPPEIAIRGMEITFKVPEPGSLTLIGAALAAMGLMLRRRQKLDS